VYTDGLVERRDEDIDQGLQRLVAVAAALDGPVEALVSALLTAMTSDAPGDDVAILALRRTDA
jgi:hypothetical protein